jgi:hypothetical protein
MNVHEVHHGRNRPVCGCVERAMNRSPEQPTAPVLLTPSGTAAVLRVDAGTVIRWADTGHLASTRGLPV